MIFLETSRLMLRTVTPEDAAAIHTWRSDPRCARYQRGQVTEYGEIAALMAEHRADVLSVDAPFMAVMALRDTGEPVGEIVVMPQDGAISLGFTVSPLHQRQGYAFEVPDRPHGATSRPVPPVGISLLHRPGKHPQHGAADQAGLP